MEEEYSRGDHTSGTAMSVYAPQEATLQWTYQSLSALGPQHISRQSSCLWSGAFYTLGPGESLFRFWYVIQQEGRHGMVVL